MKVKEIPCTNEQGNVIERITEKYSHLLFFFLLVVMFLFLLLTELFALKPAQRQPQSQEGHKMQELNPGKQAMLELFWKPGFFPVLCWTLELSRWFKEGSGGHYKEPKAET